MFKAEIQRYFNARILKLRIVFMMVLLFVAASLSRDFRNTNILILAFACALFMTSFRLWDDLADRTFDRQRQVVHYIFPESQVFYFQLLQWLMIVLCSALLFILCTLFDLLFFLFLQVAFIVMYKKTENQPKLRFFRVGFVLSKYPAWILLLADQPFQLRVISLAILVYLIPIIDESIPVAYEN